MPPDGSSQQLKADQRRRKPERAESSLGRSLNAYRPVLADDRGAGEADKEAALEGAWDVFDLYLECCRVSDLIECAVSRVVAAVCDEGTPWIRPVHPQLRLAAQGGEGFQGDLPPKGVDLDRQATCAQRVNQLARVGDHDQALLAR